MSFDARKEVLPSGIAINPGSGPVDDSSMEDAVLNMYHFRKDLIDLNPVQVDGDYIITNKQKERNGRYLFDLLYASDTEAVNFEIEMPGLPLNEVRYMKTEGQNIWDFPRLYVNGNSWVWKYALDSVFWMVQ